MKQPVTIEEKAAAWDQLGAEIEKYYIKEDGELREQDFEDEEFEDEEFEDGLIGIGELAATAFGWH